MITDPTNVPTGDRRPVPVLLAPPRPTTVPAVLLAAARIIETNGFWASDWVEDAFDRRLTTPHASRRMNLVGAIRCAVAGDPHRESQLADMAIGYVALSLGDGPAWTDAFSLRAHVDIWAEEPGRTAANAVALLEYLAAAPERAA
ncbi:hypothetical protein [Streptomyces sp. CC208A]|uniref:DUF6197 family protein n=1 Tax=Streptomyces sp. CC208A TaxID=3044573 RepID=UPI0024A924AE|nr:hypothetical protein [Streptomyces sp. CC208A]